MIPHLQNQRGSSDSLGYPLTCSLAHPSVRCIFQDHAQIGAQAIGLIADLACFDAYGSLARPESSSLPTLFIYYS